MKTEEQKQFISDLKRGKNVTMISHDKKKCKKFLKKYKVLLDGAVALTGVMSCEKDGKQDSEHLLIIRFLDANQTNLMGFDIPTENTITEYLDENPEDYTIIVNSLIYDIEVIFKEGFNADVKFSKLKMKVFERELDAEN